MESLEAALIPPVWIEGIRPIWQMEIQTSRLSESKAQCCACKSMPQNGDRLGLEQKRERGQEPEEKPKEKLMKKKYLQEAASEEKRKETIIPGSKIQETKIQETKIQETEIQETKIQETEILETEILETKILESKIPYYRRLLGRNKALLHVSDMLYCQMEKCGKAVMIKQDGLETDGKEGVSREADGTARTEAAGGAAVLYVMAPVLCLFIAWVIKSALASGKKRLYFLARDGYSMYQAASVLCNKLQIPIECRYLYCSRYAWRSALYWLLGDEALHYVCLGGMGVTLRKVCARAGLTGEEAVHTACLLNREGSQDIPLGPAALKELREELAGCKFFLDRMKKHSRSVYPEVCGYLEQEGLLEPGSWALVDSGWTGSMQKSLRQLLASLGYQDKVEGYYFGLYELPEDSDPKSYHSWYFGPEDGLWRKVFFSNSLFECILSAENGMTTGYRFLEGRFQPVFEKKWNPNQEKIRASTDMIKRYAGELAKIWEGGSQFLDAGKYKAVESGRDMPRTVLCLLRAFMEKPSLEEAEYFGSYVFCDDVIGEGSGRVAARLSSSQIRDNRLLHKAAALLGKKRAAEESAWMEGSIRLAGMGDRELLHCAAYKCLLYTRKRISRIFGKNRKRKKQN